MRSYTLVAGAVGALLASGSASAHHGLDFLLVQTAHLPEKGAGYVVTRFDAISSDEDEVEFEPAILYGATDRFAVELHSHYEKPDGEPSRYESIAPAVHFRVTPMRQPFTVGISAEYEIANASDDDDVVSVAGIVGYEMAMFNVVGNLIYEKPTGSSGEWGYAAGIRHTFGEKHGLGLELMGSLESEGSSEAMVGYYGELSERITLNAGIGTGVDNGPDGTARLGFIWRFK
jgi:hypothetical protein